MGKLTYDSTLVVNFDDRLLAHLQVVIGAKLKRGDSFSFSWADSSAVGSGRSVIWLHPGVPVAFKYYSRSQALNMAWVEAMMVTANSPGGLHSITEPAETSA
jgi:hypothetical protein